MEGIHKATELGYRPVKVKGVLIYSFNCCLFFLTTTCDKNCSSPAKEFILPPPPPPSFSPQIIFGKSEDHIQRYLGKFISLHAAQSTVHTTTKHTDCLAADCRVVLLCTCLLLPPVLSWHLSDPAMNLAKGVNRQKTALQKDFFFLVYLLHLFTADSDEGQC